MPHDGLVLLDETDTRRRILQHALILDGILLLLVAGALIKATDTLWLPGMIVLAVGLVSLLLGFFVKVRWTVTYKGHVIRFENDPFRGERLYIDDDLVAKGGLGVRMVLPGQHQARPWHRRSDHRGLGSGPVPVQVPDHGHSGLSVEA